MPGLRDRKKKLRRARILQAAIRAFNSGGFSSTTMQEIANEADLAVGTLYNYFPSKNDLLLGILERKMEEIRRIDPRLIMQLFRSEKEGSRIIARVVKEVVGKAFVLSKRNWFEAFAALFASRPDVQRGIALDLEAIDLLQGILGHMQRRALVRADAPVGTMAVNLYSLVAFQFMGYVFMPEVDENTLMRGLDDQIRLAFAGMAPPSRAGGDGPPPETPRIREHHSGGTR
jgi:AcrR family transcriptional regulator